MTDIDQSAALMVYAVSRVHCILAADLRNSSSSWDFIIIIIIIIFCPKYNSNNEQHYRKIVGRDSEATPNNCLQELNIDSRQHIYSGSNYSNIKSYTANYI